MTFAELRRTIENFRRLPPIITSWQDGLRQWAGVDTVRISPWLNGPDMFKVTEAVTGERVLIVPKNLATAIQELWDEETAS